jgi:Uncharacterized protein conserved in bacteria (DUF2255)
MIAWTEEELGRIGEAQELQLTSERPDGTFRPYVTMWVVRVDDQLYVPSAIVEYQSRAGCHLVERDRVGGLVPCQLDVAKEGELPDQIYRTFAGDLLSDVDAVRRLRVASLRYHRRSLFPRSGASKGWFPTEGPRGRRRAAACAGRVASYGVRSVPHVRDLLLLSIYRSKE